MDGEEAGKDRLAGTQQGVAGDAVRRPAKKGDRPFDPSRYLRKLGGKDYLEVKWRLL